MSVEQNKAVARRFIEEVWNQGRLDVADELLATNLINHQAAEPTKGRDAFKKFVVDFRAAGMRFLWVAMVVSLWSAVDYYVRVLRRIRLD